MSRVPEGEPMTTERPPTKRKRGQISVRGSTYDKLRAYARRHGTLVDPTVDAIITKWLDEQERTS